MELDGVSINPKVHYSLEILISMVQSLDHVLFKLFLRDPLSLLVEHTFIAHVLEPIYRRKQTGPDLNFDVGVGLGLEV